MKFVSKEDWPERPKRMKRTMSRKDYKALKRKLRFDPQVLEEKRKNDSIRSQQLKARNYKRW